MERRVAAILPLALAMACGGDDSPPSENQPDARADVKNACGGERPLAFLGRPASPAAPCGACASGALVCAAPDILVCVGSTDASCPDGGTTNLCGGRAALTLDGMPATPGQPCGPCRNGMTICASPEVVACLGAGPTTACRDAGGDGVIADAARADSPGDSSRDAAPPPDVPSSDAIADVFDDTISSDTTASDTSGDTAFPDMGPTDSSSLNPCGGYGPLRYQGADALPGARCGSCQEGVLVCDSPNLLACSGQSTSDVCTADVAAANVCGGMGPLTWRGVQATMGARCGACPSTLVCASPMVLACVAPPSCADAGPSDSCDIPPSAYTAPAPTLPAPPTETAPAATTATTLTLAANWLVYNPFDFRLYASVPSVQGTGGNAIAVIDPYNATVVESIFVGSEPRRMALSDDGESLWVALDGSGHVRQVNLVSRTAGQQFRVGTDGSTLQWFADNLAVLPGTHNSVVVSRYSRSSTATGSPVVYDDGVPRAYAGASANNPMLLIPTYSAQLIFAYDNRSSGFRLSTTCVNANGLFIKQTSVPFTGYDTTFSFAENFIYTSYGTKYDIASGTTVATSAGRGLVAADAPHRRVYFLALATSQTAATVSAFNMDTLASAGSENVPPALPAAPTLGNFVRWGRYGYAFRVNTQSIVIARSALVASAP